MKRSLFKVVVLLILVCFAGCVTTKIDYVENDKLPKKKVYRIAEVYMSDGKVMDLRETEPKYKASYKGIKNVITYYDSDYNTKYIELKDVMQIKIEILESNIILTVFVIAGIVAVLYGLLYILALGFVGPGKY